MRRWGEAIILCGLMVPAVFLAAGILIWRIASELADAKLAEIKPR
jgi:hypothetical protein